MARYDDIIQTVGRTPVVRVRRLGPKDVELYVKVGAMNPMGSVKDRLAVGIIEAAEKSGTLKSGADLQELLTKHGVPFQDTVGDKLSSLMPSWVQPSSKA
jgi:threonine synthase